MSAPAADGRPPLRPVLATIPAYRPGRPPVPVEGRPTYKLSSNENPYPPLPGVVAAATDALGRVNRYPDMGAQRFYDVLARRLDVEVAHLAGGTGSVAVLYHLLQAFCEPGDEVVLPWRSFEAYPIGIGLVGARAVTVPLDADARHDLPAMLAAITERTRVVLVCTPNNPTGPAVGHAELAAFLDAVPSDVLVVVDEAYVEFVRDPDAADGMALGRGRENVVVLRTFSKAYGLAGLRVGYAVATPRVAEAIRKVAVPFGVSDLAQAAAVASLEAEDELLVRVQAIVDERERVVAALRDQGWAPPDSQTNFVWLPLGERSVDFAAACSDAGVMVRPFAGEGVRVTIAEPEADDVLLGVAGRWAPTAARLG